MSFSMSRMITKLHICIQYNPTDDDIVCVGVSSTTKKKCKFIRKYISLSRYVGYFPSHTFNRSMFPFYSEINFGIHVNIQQRTGKSDVYLWIHHPVARAVAQLPLRTAAVSSAIQDCRLWNLLVRVIEYLYMQNLCSCSCVKHIVHSALQQCFGTSPWEIEKLERAWKDMRRSYRRSIPTRYHIVPSTVTCCCFRCQLHWLASVIAVSKLLNLWAVLHTDCQLNPWECHSVLIIPQLVFF